MPDRGQYLALIDGKEKESPPWQIFPAPCYELDALFIKKMWYRAEQLGYMQGKQLHVTVFRRFMERLFDCIEEQPNIRLEDFGASTKSSKLAWKDLRVVFESGTEDVVFPQVQLSFAERCNFVFEGQGGSVLGAIVGALIFAAILVNVIVIFGLLSEDIGVVCAIIFSIEYLCKLIASPFCRYSIFHEEWLLEKTVPDPKDADAALPAGMTGMARLWTFVFTPMNVIDLCSILPTWIEPLLENAPINLQFLRALRLFRLFRVLKFGKFSSTLSVLGVTIGNSVQAIGVLCLYIAMISMLAGAVIQQFEYPVDTSVVTDESLEKLLNTSFSNVPMAMKWVAGRMVTMQHSLPDKKALPQSLVSAFIVIFLGLFKGVIFVLPIATITEAYKRADTNLKAQQRLQMEVEDDKVAPLGTEWCKDPKAPAARLECYSQDGTQMALGSFNLPFYEKGQTVKFWVPLIGQLKGICSGYPGVEINVEWQPDPESRPKERLPKGTLKLEVIQGADFRASSGGKWKIIAEVPVKLYPEANGDHLKREEFEQDVGDNSSPTFSKVAEFKVFWHEKVAKKNNDEEWQKEVLKMLEVQGEKLAALEAKVKK